MEIITGGVTAAKGFKAAAAAAEIKCGEGSSCKMGSECGL